MTETIFDADNHYYEALDAFTRFLPSATAPSIFQWAQIDGRSYPVLADAGAFVELVGGQVRWKLRELAAGIGVRLVISGVPNEARGFAEVN